MELEDPPHSRSSWEVRAGIGALINGGGRGGGGGLGVVRLLGLAGLAGEALGLRGDIGAVAILIGFHLGLQCSE